MNFGGFSGRSPPTPLGGAVFPGLVGFPGAQDLQFSNSLPVAWLLLACVLFPLDFCGFFQRLCSYSQFLGRLIVTQKQACWTCSFSPQFCGRLIVMSKPALVVLSSQTRCLGKVELVGLPALAVLKLTSCSLVACLCAFFLNLWFLSCFAEG